RELFSASQPENTGGEELTVAQLLDGAASRIDSQFAGDPQSRGVLLAELGEVHRALGNYDESIQLLESARAVQAPTRRAQPPDYLYSTVALVLSLNEVYRYGDAMAIAGEALAAIDATTADTADTWRQTLGSAKAAALSGLGRLDEAEP